MIGIMAAIAIAGGVTSLFLSSNPTSPEDGKDVNARLLAPSTPGSVALGSENAETTIIEFGDYRCPHCAKFNTETKDRLLAAYVETGKARFMFKGFTVLDSPTDKSSTKAAAASYCASEQDKYWEYHDSLFAYTDAGNSGPLTSETLQRLAADVGVKDLDSFSKCVDSQEYLATVSENNELATSLGLKGTPVFLIVRDGETPFMIQGAQPFEVFRDALDKVNAGL